MQVVTVGSMQATIISAEPDSPFVASPVDVVSQQAQVTAAGIELAVRLGFVKNVMDLEACFGKAMFAFENPTRAAVDDAEEEESTKHFQSLIAGLLLKLIFRGQCLNSYI